MDARTLAFNRFYRLASYALFLTFLCASPLMAQWEPDVRLTYNDSISWTANNNTWWIASGPAGGVHVVWYDKRFNYFYNVFYKRSTDWGVSWSSDTCLVSNPSGSAWPSVVLSGSYLHVIWSDYRDGNLELYYKRSTDDGASWEMDRRLTDDLDDSWLASLSASGQDVHLVWRSDQGGSPYIFYKRSTDNGANWSPDTFLSHPSILGAFPSVATRDTLVHMVWPNFRNSRIFIYYYRSTDRGVSWTPDTGLTNSPALDYPSIATSESVVHLVWSDHRDGNTEIYYKRSTDCGITWSSDIRLSFDPNSSCYPSVCASGSNVHVVWSNNQNGAIGVSYMRSTNNGETWGPDTSLTPLDSINRPCVAVSGSVVHVAWMDYRDGNWEIYYKRNPTGNSGVEVSPSSEFRVPSREVFPNPFTSFTAVPGHEKEQFALYDVSGRKVGIYKGDRIGSDLSAGIYFLKPEGRDAKPLRIVKLR